MSDLSGHIYDAFMKPFEKRKLHLIRTDLIGEASGEILEIGSGTGINFPYYKQGKVTALEPNFSMRRRSLIKIGESKVPIQVREGDAQHLNYPDDTFDTVVSTLVFCSVSDPRRVLREIKRVCKADGRLLLFEHVRLEEGPIAKAQDVLNPVWTSITGGCSLNRDTVRLLREEGMEITEVKRYLKGVFLSIRALNRKS